MERLRKREKERKKRERKEKGQFDRRLARIGVALYVDIKIDKYKERG
jgi:hypothetical protein